VPRGARRDPVAADVTFLSVPARSMADLSIRLCRIGTEREKEQSDD
jgi:hypothetical protein